MGYSIIFFDGPCFVLVTLRKLLPFRSLFKGGFMNTLPLHSFNTSSTLVTV